MISSIRRFSLVFLLTFICTISFSQAVRVTIEKDAIAYKYRAGGVWRFQNYKPDNDLNFILFCQTNDSSKNNPFFVNELVKVLKKQNYVQNISIYIVYFDYDAQGLENLKNSSSEESQDKNKCKIGPPIIEMDPKSNKFCPPIKHIEYFENNIDPKILLYIDKSSKKYKLIDDFVSFSLEDPKIYNYGRIYENIAMVKDPFAFIQTLNIIGKVARMNEDVKSSVYKELEDVKDSLSILKDSIKSYSAGLKDKIKISLVPNFNFRVKALENQSVNSPIKLNITDFNTYGFGVTAYINYTIPKKLSAVRMGFSFDRCSTRMFLQTDEQRKFMVANNIKDAFGEAYDRYLFVNSIKEEINIQSNRILFSINYMSSNRSSAKSDKKNAKNYNWFLGPFGGFEVGTKVAYSPVESSVSYHGVYAQYNPYDTLFNNVGDFGSEQQFKKEKITFYNSGLTAHYGLEAGLLWRLPFFDDDFDHKKGKIYLNLKAAYTRQISSYSNPRFNADFPIFSNQHYNSLLFRSNYYRFSFLTASLGINIFL